MDGNQWLEAVVLRLVHGKTHRTCSIEQSQRSFWNFLYRPHLAAREVADWRMPELIGVEEGLHGRRAYPILACRWGFQAQQDDSGKDPKKRLPTEPAECDLSA